MDEKIHKSLKKALSKTLNPIQDQPSTTDSNIQKRRKVDPTEKQRRVNEVLDLMLSGSTSNLICQCVSSKYSITPRQVNRYIADAYKIMVKSFERSTDEKIIDYVAKLNFLYERALKLNNVGEARKIIMDLANLSGSVTTKLEVKTEVVEAIKQAPTAQLLKLLKN